MIEAQWQILEKAIKTLPLSPSQKRLVQNKSREIQAFHLWEQGKMSLEEGRVEEAEELFSKSNAQLPKPKLAAMLLGLKVAPGTTRKLVALATKKRARENGLAYTAPKTSSKV